MARKHEAIDGYNYYITPDTDDEYQENSSDDEERPSNLDLVFQGTPQQKRHAFQRLAGFEDPSSSEDEFEQIMNFELDKKMDKLESSWKQTDLQLDSSEATEGETAIHSLVKPKTNTKSKESEASYSGGDDSKQGRNNSGMTNDDLLYDPDADDEDQRWMDDFHNRSSANRKSSGDERPPQSSGSKHPSSKRPNSASKRPNSDAVLNCPACMTILCNDCQRHATYHHQYRAMFVLNCAVDREQRLRHKRAKQKKVFKRHKRRQQPQHDDDDDDDDVFHPVKCAVCDTEVGVYDADEMYHFFNVIAGHT